MREAIARAVEATEKASSILPKFDRVQYNSRYTTAIALERLVIENTIAFTSTENGFAAICLRGIFDLAGVECEKVSYWLKKAEDNPESYARWLQQLKDKL